MMEIKITPYTHEDDKDALELESMCSQGSSIRLQFERPAFHNRSDVYENSVIMCARITGKLVGVSAGARKKIQFKGSTVNALYGYDVRVHPDHRQRGVGTRVSNAVIDYFGKGIDCYYTLVAAQNNKAAEMSRRAMRAEVSIPLLYLILPVGNMELINPVSKNVGARTNHMKYISRNPGLDFLPPFNEDKMHGHFSGISIGENTGVSIWSNESILAERILQLPLHLRAAGIARRILHPWITLPYVPRVGNVIQSWFLYDLFAENEDELKALINHVKSLAAQNEKELLYLLFRVNDPMVERIKKLKMQKFTLPYLFFARGRVRPDSETPIYIDVRDL